MAVVQGVGYPEPDRSHFRSMEIWHTASVEPTAAGRPAGSAAASTRPSRAGAPTEAFPRGLSLTDSLPQALQADEVIVPVVAQLDAFGEEAEATRSARSSAGELSTGPGGRRRAGRRSSAARPTRSTGRPTGSSRRPRSTSRPVEYPEGELGEQLARAAQILAGRMGVRVLFASQDGYDTHADQAEAHGNLLERSRRSLAAFRSDLAARKLADKVVVMVFSEFGRRVDENASRGTDHGAASCLFLVGGEGQGGPRRQVPQPREARRRRPDLQHRLPLGLRHPPRPLARLPGREGPRQAVPDARPDRGFVRRAGIARPGAPGVRFDIELGQTF